MKKSILLLFTFNLFLGLSMAQMPQPKPQPPHPAPQEQPGQNHGPQGPQHGGPQHGGPQHGGPQHPAPQPPVAPHPQPIMVPTPPIAIPAHINVATPHEIDMLIQTLNQEPFDQGKLKAALFFVEHHYLYCEQIYMVAKRFTFDDNKLKFLEIAYDHCLDKGNYAYAAKALTFSGNRSKLFNYIHKH